MIDKTSCYVNGNTWTLTSNIKNTSITKESAAFMTDILRPVEDMEKILKTPMNLASKTSVNTVTNSLNIAEGAVFCVNDGYLLRVKSKGIEVHSTTDIYNHEAYLEAQKYGSTLGLLLRNAGGTQKTVAVGNEQLQAWTDNVTDLMKYMGIDTYKDFTVNGMKYSRTEDGYLESEANCIARETYEQQKHMNKTYEFADERTKKRIEHISEYYLVNVPKSIKTMWQETLEKTGINPFPSGYCGVLQQLAQEKDFATDGNDKIFGESVETFISGIKVILERIDNPLNEIDNVHKEYLKNEKEFYTSLLSSIQSM